MSHRSVYRMALERGMGSVVVLEDDAVFTDRFDEKLEWLDDVPGDWGCIHLGGSRWPPPGCVLDDIRPRHVAGHCWELRDEFCAHFCAFRHDVLEEFAGKEWLGAPFDDVIRGRFSGGCFDCGWYGLMTADEASRIGDWGLAIQENRHLDSDLEESRSRRRRAGSRAHVAGDECYHAGDHGGAFEEWERGATLGHRQCIMNLVWAYTEGIGTEADPEKVALWTERAHEAAPS